MTENIAVLMDNEGFTLEDQEPIVEVKEIAGILEKHAGGKGELIAVLEAVQERYGYLPEDALRIVADETGSSLVDVFAVATFYSSFSLKPRGRHIVCACKGTACHVRGGARIVDALEQQLGITAGETTPDKEFTLETVNCLGACALGPVVVIDGQYFSKVKKTSVRQLINEAQNKSENIGIHNDKRVFPIEASCPRCSFSLMDNSRTIDGYSAIRLTVVNGHRHGRLMLSSLYGSSGMKAEHDIPPGTIARLLCPQCHSQLAGHDECVDCGAPMAAMLVTGGGMLKICSRLGCRGHMLDII